jgi:hypothetical protein
VNVWEPYESVRGILPLEAGEKLIPFCRTLLGATGLVIDHKTVELQELKPVEIVQLGVVSVPVVVTTVIGAHVAPQLFHSFVSVIVPTNAISLSAHARTYHVPALGNVYEVEIFVVPPAEIAGVGEF